MKINQTIREKRKELSLTQEQLAEFLGVSAPAVHKWEKGSSYPDITLLPALARLLKIDLNTLMSFREDLTDIEIENFVNQLDQTVQQQGYEEAFQMAISKIREYPTCDRLIYSAVFYLDGALFLYHVPNPEQYRETFETFYKRLSVNETPEIKDLSTSMLIAYARNRGDYAKAEELIHALPFSEIDKEVQLAVLYQQQQKYEDAKKLWEHRILKGVTEIQAALINLLEIALQENRNADADFLAALYEKITCQFSLPEWMRYNAHLLLAVSRKDKAQSLSVLSKMLPAMKKEWKPWDNTLYQSMEGADVTSLSCKVADSLCQELKEKDEYAFLRDCPGFHELIAQMNA